MSNILDQILHELECMNDMLRSVVQVNERDITRSKYIENIIEPIKVVRTADDKVYLFNDYLPANHGAGKSTPLASPEAMSIINVKYKALTGQQADNATMLTILDGLSLKSYDYAS